MFLSLSLPIMSGDVHAGGPFLPYTPHYRENGMGDDIDATKPSASVAGYHRLSSSFWWQSQIHKPIFF